MSEDKIKSCRRCHQVFDCNVNDIVNCQCTEVTLSSEAKQFLQKTMWGCLCKKCLADFNYLTDLSMHLRFPAKDETLTEGIHYYKENNCIVFTELYHLLRGSCCQNNCRHCVYGFKKG